MPAEFFALPLDPFQRNRHRCEPSNRRTRFFCLPTAFDCDDLPLTCCPSLFFTLSFIFKRIRLIEPLLNPFRHTVATQQKYVEPLKLDFEVARKK